MNASKSKVRIWSSEYPVGDPFAFSELNDPMSIFTVAAPIVGGLLASDSQSSAAQQAAQTSAGATDRSIALQEKMFNQLRADQMPWLEAGKNALTQLTAGTSGPNAAYMKPFSMADYQADPGYAFRLSEGMKGLERSAAARGGLLSGATLKGIQNYGQGLASQEYQNAFNRYQTNQGNQFNRLAGIAGVGQTAAGNIGQAGQNYAGTAGNLNMMNAANMGNAQLAAGQARASSYGGIGNVLGGMDWNSFNNPLSGNNNYVSNMGGANTSLVGFYNSPLSQVGYP